MSNDWGPPQLAQRPWIVPIPGTTKLHRLRENAAAVAVALTPGELSEIREVIEALDVQGARYSEAFQKMVNQ